MPWLGIRRSARRQHCCSPHQERWGEDCEMWLPLTGPRTWSAMPTLVTVTRASGPIEANHASRCPRSPSMAAESVVPATLADGQKASFRVSRLRHRHCCCEEAALLASTLSPGLSRRGCSRCYDRHRLADRAYQCDAFSRPRPSSAWFADLPFGPRNAKRQLTAPSGVYYVLLCRET